LIECEKILKGIDGVGFVYLSDADVVRHPVVRNIIRAYEEYERKKNGSDK
jgi:phosphate starvation-inducible PhoH-like protein